LDSRIVYSGGSSLFSVALSSEEKTSWAEVRMEMSTPTKEESQEPDCRRNCEDRDCSGSRASEISTSYNSSPGAMTEADDPNNSGNVSTATSATSDMQPLQLPIEEEQKEDSAVLVMRNLFAIMQSKDSGVMALSRKAAPDSSSLQLLSFSERGAVDEQQEATVPGAAEEVQEAEKLRRELESARQKLEGAAGREAVIQAEAQAREDALLQKTADLEAREAQFTELQAELEEKARRDEEISKLQRHIFEVENSRIQKELDRAIARKEALERELKQASKQVAKQQRRNPQADQTSEQAPMAQEVISRHELALRASFEDESHVRQGTKQRAAKAKSGKAGDGGSEANQGWFSCCSVQTATKRASQTA